MALALIFRMKEVLEAQLSYTSTVQSKGGQRSDLAGAAPHNPSRNKTPLDYTTISCFFSWNIFNNPRQRDKIEYSTAPNNKTESL